MEEIQVQGLGKTFLPRIRKGLFRSEVRSVPALSDVHLEIRPGEVFGLLGPNGAGKTTLIKCLTTLLVPTSGDAWVHGYHVVREARWVQANIGCMLMGERGLYWKLTGRENLEFFGSLYYLPTAECRRRAQSIIDLLELGEICDRTVETYSSGQKMKLAFGKTLINDAPVLILDEPTNTLDVPSAHALRATVQKLNRQGKTILYTTHIISEAETLCDRVAIIDRGQVIAQGKVAELKASLEREHITRIEGVIPEPIPELMRALPDVIKVAVQPTESGSQLTVISRDHTQLLMRLIDILTSHSALVSNISTQEVTLEDVFVAKTGRSFTENGQE